MNQQILEDFTVKTVFSSNATHAPSTGVLSLAITVPVRSLNFLL